MTSHLLSQRPTLRRAILRPFTLRSVHHVYWSLLAGISVAILPVEGIQIQLLAALALLLGLNLMLLVLGTILVQLLPITHLAAYWLARRIDPTLPDFTGDLLLAAEFLGDPVRRWPYLLGCVGVLAAMAVVLIPVVRVADGIHRHLAGQRCRGQVFRDASGWRAGLLRTLGRVAVAAGGVLALTFLASLAQSPSLPSLGLVDPDPYAAIAPVHPAAAAEVGQGKGGPAVTVPAVATRNLAQVGTVFAFHVPWDPNSEISLRQHIAAIDVVIPEWFHLGRDLSISDARQPHVDEFLSQSKALVTPSISNLIGQDWNRQAVMELISSPATSERFINQILQLLRSGPYDGINLDFENLRPADRVLYRSFVEGLASRLHAAGFTISVDVSVGEPDSYDYAGLAAAVDHLVVMLYDEHYATGGPGPLASQGWYEQHLAALAGLPADKVVLGLGNYGYDWTQKGGTPAVSLTVPDALEIARAGGLEITWDPEQANPHYTYRDRSGVHQVWFLDAATTHNQVQRALASGFGNVGLWVLGSEDASIWSVFDEFPGSPGLLGRLSTVQNAPTVRHIGTGEILRIASTPVAGSRELVTRDGLITGEVYTKLPVPYRLARYGQASARQVVLTVDDGPDPRYTRQVLDILQARRVPAAFFVIGTNALKQPDLVRRMVADGHELGVHTFTHPDVSRVSDAQYGLELSLTQRVVQNLTGRSTVLFRPPAGIDLFNAAPEEYLPLLRAQARGYTVVGDAIDPKDWTTPSADAIVDRVLEQAAGGGVILLHDSGGDRSHTVAALPRIIDTLHAKGFQFTSIATLIGRSPADLMPPVPAAENTAVVYTQGAVELVQGASGIVGVLFFVAIALGVLRFIFLIVFSRRHARRPRRLDEGSTTPAAVSVVIAAYNEEAVICRTIQSVLASSQPVTEVIVVNDGSTDGTYAALRAAYGSDSRVRLLDQANGGKASAINRGFRAATSEIVVACDADTIVAPDAIGRLAARLSDPEVAAVSGNIKVGNVHNLLTRWQHIEYVVGFNLERRAFSELNAVTVVPGALGAWRRADVVACGLFADDTLAEDTDLTLALLRAGRRVTYEPRALAYTEAPADLASLQKQRYRWTYGTLQCLWKHRDLLFRGRNRVLGWIALPSMWVFQYCFQVLAPLADVVFLAGLASGQPQSVLLFYLVFLLVDYLAALHAFRLEGEHPGVLVWLWLQRIVYRFIIMIVIFKTIGAALRGIPVGWNKLARQGDVAVAATR